MRKKLCEIYVGFHVKGQNVSLCDGGRPKWVQVPHAGYCTRPCNLLGEFVLMPVTLAIPVPATKHACCGTECKQEEAQEE